MYSKYQIFTLQQLIKQFDCIISDYMGNYLLLYVHRLTTQTHTQTHTNRDTRQKYIAVLIT